MTDFSNRTNWNSDESELARAHRERLEAGLPILDLTAANPTRCGFDYPSDLLAPLSQAEAFDYDPDPKGLLKARRAVAAYYADVGAQIAPENIVLTTSTSEAYTYLFKLLCNPGDAILVPQPSYPLFDFLGQAESIEVLTTPLLYDYGWQLDLESLRGQLRDQNPDRKIRALVIVHPNNPTGHFVSRDESRELAEICLEFGLSLIVDEVFLDYALTTEGESGRKSSFALRETEIPLYIVSGISKICGLPQMKAAWLVAFGPGFQEAMARLEILADTYLSMNAPIQHALPTWLSARGTVQGQIRERVQANLAELDRCLEKQNLVNRLEFEGGWYAVLRIPATQADEATAMELLKLGVWVHPGYFFGFKSSGWLVVSLLTRTLEFQLGITRVLQYVVRTTQGNL